MHKKLSLALLGTALAVVPLSVIAKANLALPTQPAPMVAAQGATTHNISQDASVYNAAPIKLNRAIAIAQGQAPNAQVVEVSFDDDNGGEYEVTLLSANGKFEVDISALNGQVVKQKQKRIKAKERNELQAYKVAPVSLTQAIAHAERTVGGSAYAVEFDEKSGANRYELKVATPTHQSYEVVINATTGAVISQKIDD